MIDFSFLFSVDLIRLGLIQAQKTRVDASAALEALDQLLRANELNFAILAAVPSLLIVFGTWKWISSILFKSKAEMRSRKKYTREMELSLRELQNILGKSDPECRGRLVVAAISYYKNSTLAFQEEHPIKWIEEDLIFILDDKVEISARLLASERLWRYISH